MTYILRRLGVIAFGIYIASVPVFALAQAAAEGLQIKPAIIEDNISPGASADYSVTVKNVADTAKTFYLSTQDIKGLDDAGQPVFAKAGEQTGYELASWISLPATAVTLGAGETKTVNFSVHVPNKVSPGDHFGVIFLTNAPVAPGTGSGSAISFSVGTIVSLKIPGDVHEEAQLREFSTDNIVYGTADVHFASKIENLGNVLVRPHGVIEITDMLGRKVSSIEVNGTGAPVFPNSSRKYASEWTASGFAFGRYEAVASYSYGDTSAKTITATTSFWVLPIKPVAIVLGVLLVLILGMYAAVRFYIRGKLRDMGISPDSRDADYYARKYQRSGSRMMVTTLIVFLVCIVFLAALFLAFA